MATNGQALQTAVRPDELLWRGRELETIRRLIAPGCDDFELYVFGRVCEHTKLDPFLKQIYAIRRKDRTGNYRMTVQTSIDGYRVMAARSGQLAGIDDAIYDFDGEELAAAHVTVYRMVEGQRCPFSATARMKEYRPAPGADTMWIKMPFLMLAKCAESLALRKAFPAEISGVYTDTEMMQADAPEPPAV